MFNVFSNDVYVLLELGATLLFVTPLVANYFSILHDILHEPFIASTPVGKSVVAKSVHRNCPIILPNCNTLKIQDIS